MRTRSKQASVLRPLSHEVVNDNLILTVRMVDTRPGRSDIPVGPPMTVLVPRTVFLDVHVSDLANTVWSNHLKDLEEEATRLALEGQDPFPGM